MAEIPLTSSNWQLDSVNAEPGGRRSVAAATGDAHLSSLLGDRFELSHTFRATSPRRRGVEPLPPLDVTVPVTPGVAYLLAVRHESSGAISFHAPKLAPPHGGAGLAPPRRGVEPLPETLTFEVEFSDAPDPATRSLNPIKAVKGVVLKAVGKLADLTVPLIGAEVEELLWKRKNLRRGWLKVTPDSLKSGNFEPADFSVIANSSDRCLLLLHGTFSNTAGAFHSLVTTRSKTGQDFFAAVQPLYGDRIFAFNHFTASQTPEQNAIDLIAGLSKPATFDVITHSRGGLVLRNLVERPADLGPNAGHFRAGRVVLVASPNEGTPLATADRFDKLISWWTNLLELFPENPFSTTAEYIGDALNFIARHVVDALPGLDSMNMTGAQITDLQKLPFPVSESCSALVSNYQPTGNLLKRILDLGIDGVFGMANDLVVPSAGGWKTSQRPAWVGGARIGCFGLNLSSSAAEDGVIHTTYFSQPETIDFLIESVEARPTGLSPVDPDVNLPFFTRRSITPLPAPFPPVPVPLPAETAAFEKFLPAVTAEADDVLHLFLISADDYLPPDVVAKEEYRTAILLGTFRNARVVETIFLRGAARAPKKAAQPAEDLHWNRIITINDRIRKYVDGKAGVKMPDDDELHNFGLDLFNAMFPATVRRLYDVARVARAQAGQRLDIVITSMINWVADKPWEFAYDPSRQTFLATEDVNFTRNVLTAVPAEEPLPRSGPLHILVVVAQPIGLGALSADEEERVVRRGFQSLEEAGLATFEFMMGANIDLLHKRLRQADVDILHFIGHGEYDEKQQQGYLVFVNQDGGMQLVSAESLRQVLCHRGIRLVFLNACETAMVGRSQNPFDFNRGVAPKLVAGGIPVVVANQYKVLDVSATEFAKHFYWWLALGSTVGDAAREARVAVNYAIAGENIDWAVPVVFARNPNRMIYTSSEAERAGATLKSAPAVRGPQACTGFKGLKIGLWDVNHVLPALDDFSKVLRNAQTDFCFQTVDVSAPLGTWRRVTPQDGGTPKGYIDGGDVAAKLRDHVASLGMDRLICITSFALADKESKGLALWNEDPDLRVAIISAELILSEMGADRSKLNRFLANMVVSALAGQGGHTDPPTTCPNNYSDTVDPNPTTRLEYLTAAQQFCDACRTRLGPKVTAMDKILAAY